MRLRLFGLALCAGAAMAVAMPSVPALAGAAKPDCTGLPAHSELPVVDAADVVDPESEAWLVADLLRYHVTGHEAIVAATVSNLGGDDVSSFAKRLFDCWGIGDAESDNGVLVLVAMRERRVRISIGAGLEGRLSDDQLEAAIAQMTPALKSGDVATGLRVAAASLATDLGAELPDTRADTAGATEPSFDPGDVDLPAGFPYADGGLPDGFGPFDSTDRPGAGFFALFGMVPLFIFAMIIFRVVRAAATAGSSYRGPAWRGGFPGSGTDPGWDSASLLHRGAWHDPGVSGTPHSWSGSSWGSGTGSSGSAGSAGSSGSSGGSSSFGGGSSGGGGASGSW